MREASFDRLLRGTAELSIEFINGVDERPVGPPRDPSALRAALSGPLPERGVDAARVIDERLALEIEADQTPPSGR